MKITPDILLQAYCQGIFPMADEAGARELYWYDPPLRGVIPLDDRFHVPRRLARTMAKTPFHFCFDKNFEMVMKQCAMPAPDRPETWINAEILSLYTELYHTGHAHSVEVYEGDVLIGGLYGVHIGGAFFGESMFSRRRDASKMALVHLVLHLKERHFSMLDAQFLTDHLAQFGAVEVPKVAYKAELEQAITLNLSFY